MKARTRRQPGRNQKRSRSKQSWPTAWLPNGATARRHYRLSFVLISSLGTVVIAAFIILARREAAWGPLPALAQFDVQPVDSAPAAIYEEDLAVDNLGRLILPERQNSAEPSQVRPELQQRIETAQARSSRVADRQASLRRVYRKGSEPLPDDRPPPMDAMNTWADPLDSILGDSETAERLRRILEGSR